MDAILSAERAAGSQALRAHIDASQGAAQVHRVCKCTELRTGRAAKVEHVLSWTGCQRSHCRTGTDINAIEITLLVGIAARNLHVRWHLVVALEPRDRVDTGSS